MTTVHQASAPVRLDFAGGWSDVAPFTTEERGVVVNGAIELRAHAVVRPGGTGYRLVSEDLGQTLELTGPGDLAPDGRLDLLKAALRLSAQGPCSLRTWSDAPAGSGLGSSGALDVALVAALDLARGRQRSPLELAAEGCRLETVEAGLPGGKQDQYAAALGGFHRFRFEGDAVAVEPLRLDPDFAAALGERTLVCYTGTSRVSSHTITRVMSAYRRRASEVVGALHTLVEVAERMAEALVAADFAEVGRLLSENWRQQQRLDRGMRTEPMARLEEAMRAAGALGGKAAGAGAGGCMFFLAGGDPGRAAHAAREAGGRLLAFRWAAEGVKAW